MLIQQLYQKTQREDRNLACTSARHQKILVGAEKGWKLPQVVENDLPEILQDLQTRTGDGKQVLMLASFSPFCLKYAASSSMGGTSRCSAVQPEPSISGISGAAAYTSWLVPAIVRLDTSVGAHFQQTSCTISQLSTESRAIE